MSKVEELANLKAKVVLQNQQREQESKRETGIIETVASNLQIPQELATVVQDLWGIGTVYEGKVLLDYLNGVDFGKQYESWYPRPGAAGYNGGAYAVVAIATWPQYGPEYTSWENTSPPGTVYKYEYQAGIYPDMSPKIRTATFRLGIILGWDKELKKIVAGTGYFDSEIDRKAPKYLEAENGLLITDLLEIPEQSSGFIITRSMVASMRQSILRVCMQSERGFKYPLINRVERNKQLITEHELKIEPNQEEEDLSHVLEQIRWCSQPKQLKK